MDKITLENYEDVKALTESMKKGIMRLAWMVDGGGWTGYDAMLIAELLNTLHHEAVAYRKWHLSS